MWNRNHIVSLFKEAEVRVTNIRTDSTGIHLEFDDAHLGFYSYQILRFLCPCAECIDEMSRVRRIDFDNIDPEIVPLDWMQVGHYALQFLWSDGHQTGIYPFTLLREGCQCSECKRTGSE